MKRMGIDQGVIETLEDGYCKTPFFVEDEFGNSEQNINIQESGKVAHCRPTVSVCTGYDMHRMRHQQRNLATG